MLKYNNNQQSLLILLITILMTSISFSASNVDWSVDYENSKKAMLWENKPGMLYFYSRSVHDSYAMQENTIQSPEIAQLLKSYQCVAIDVDQRKDLAQKFGVFRIPTAIFLDSASREIDRTVGYKSNFVFNAHITRCTNAIEASKQAESLVKEFDTSAVNILQPRENTKPFTVVFKDPNKRQRQLYLVGDFNNWREREIPMIYKNGYWGIDVNLELGQVYQYLLYNEAGEYLKDPNNPYGVISPMETFNNVMVAGRVRTSPIVENSTVMFLFYHPDAKKIEVAGNFNNWEKVQLFRNPNDPNFWGQQIKLPRGKYEYKLIVDDVWTFDPFNYTPINETGMYNNSFFVQ